MLVEYDIELLERDKEVLRGIAKTKMLTVDQIRRLYFNKKRYGYQRMKQLEKAGCVTSRPHIKTETGKKIGTCYYLTDIGFELISQEHYNPRKLIEPRKHDYRVKVGEIFVQSTLAGWEFSGSIEIKEENRLNRNTKLVCMLSRENSKTYSGKEEFAVYLLGKNPTQESMKRIQAEMVKNEKSINLAFVLHMGNELNVCNIDEKGNKTEWSDHTGMYRLHMMQFEKGLIMLKLMSDPDYLVSLIKLPFIKEQDSSELKYLGREENTFSEHLVEYFKKKCYLVDLLTNDLATRYHLKSYSTEEATQKERMVLALTPKEEMDYWQKEYPKTHYPHIHIIPVGLTQTPACSTEQG